MNKDVLDQYEALLKRAGWRDLSSRGKVRITGPDRITFLHSMISNDVERLQDGEGKYGTFLTATGKIRADFYYYRFSEFLLIDIAGELLTEFMEALQTYIIMDDVELEDISGEFGHYSVEGPKAAKVLEAVLGETPSWRSELSTLEWKGEALWWIRKEELVVPGYEIIVPTTCSQEFREALTREGRAYGMEPIGMQAYELLRMESGIPVYGIDFTGKNNPVEARLERAYSLTKGCYVGQEVVSKATLVGSVPKALSRLEIEGRVVPERGASVVEKGGKEIGKITSAVFSLMLDQPIAMAFLRKGFWTPGDVHHVESPEMGLLRAKVVERFISL